MLFRNNDYKNIRRFVRDLLTVTGNRILLSFLLQVTTGLTQGIGLLLLIPLLNLAGILPSPTATSGITGKLVDFLRHSGIPPGLVTMLLFYIVIITISAGFNRYLEVVNATIQQRFVRFLKNRLYRSVGYSEWLFVSGMKVSDIAHEITVEVQRAGQLAVQVFKSTGAVVTIVVYLVVAWLLSPAMAAVSMAGAAVLLTLGIKKNRSALSLGKSTRKSARKVYHVVLEHLSGMKTAKSFAEEERYIDDFIRYSEEVEEKKIGFVRLSSRTGLLFSVGSVILLSLYVYIGIEVAGLGATTLLALIYIFSRLMPRISALQSSYQSVLQSLPALTSVLELQDECDRHGENLNRTDHRPLTIHDSVILDDITFGYDEKEVISKLSLQIRAGSAVCISGPSGSGKTTLADLLLGLLKPWSGKILIDGQLLDKNQIFRWRKSIGYISQESFLFNDTIRNNLVWAKERLSEDEIWEALKAASADEVVRNLKNGLDTIVGDRGAQLSGGERQRIALARALVRRPALLILDEATNSLDQENETRIVQALAKIKGRTTLIIISHGTAFHPIADQLIHIPQGEHIHA